LDFADLSERALAIRAKLEAHERCTYGRAWSVEELLLGLVGDLGDLAKLVQAREGVRAVDDAERCLEHELSDVLWSTIVLAHACGVDLEKSFLRTMDELAATL
jgi:NTP pyrophosphatase (non-canonical NTP hydrolase)